MGASVGARPTALSGAPADASSNMEAMAAAGEGVAARRRNRAPRRAVDIDPSQLAQFVQAQSAMDSAPVASSSHENPSAISGLMAPSPEPTPEKVEEPKEVPKPPTPQKEMSPPKDKTPSPKPATPVKLKTPSPKQVTPPPIAAPEPAQPAAAVLEPTHEPPVMDDASKNKLMIYDSLCQKLVKDKDPSPEVLIRFLEAKLKHELPELQEKATTLEKKIGDMTEELAQRDATIADLRLKVAEAEKNAASVVASGTANALENAAINDEDVNRLRGAFEEHMQNYQQSMDQFQSFFDKITQDLESTFAELGIEENKGNETATDSVQKWMFWSFK